jgi:hypothetical protein
MKLLTAAGFPAIIIGILISGIGLFGHIQPGFAQATVISLGMVSAPPDGDVIVPLLLELESESVQIGSITAIINYNSALVTFLRGEAGFLLDGVHAGFDVQARENATDPSRSLLKLDVRTEPDGGERKALRKGLILSLMFRINKDTPVDTEIPLPFESLSAGNIDDPASRIDPVTPEAGAIEVLSADAVPYVGCFFFTH